MFHWARNAIMRFDSHNKPPPETRTQTPGPFSTPTPDQVTSPIFTTSVSPAGQEIPESRLLIKFSKGNSGSAQKFECTAEGLAEMNEVRPDESIAILKFVTRDIVMNILTSERLLDSNTDLLVGVTESGDNIELSSTLRLREFLKARCKFGSVHAHVYTAPALPVVPPSPPPPSPVPQASPFVFNMSPVEPKAAPIVPKAASVALKKHKKSKRLEKSDDTHSSRRVLRSRRNRIETESDSDAPVLPRRKRQKRGELWVRHESLSSEPSEQRDSDWESMFVKKNTAPGLPDQTGAEDRPQDLGVGSAIFEEEPRPDRLSWQEALDAQLNSPKVEHMSDLNNWQLTCRLIGIDPKETTTKPSIKMPGLNVELNQFQFFAIVLFHIWGRNGQNGGFLADGMGLGKTVQALGVVVFENLLHYNYSIVKECQASHDPQLEGKHRDIHGAGTCSGAPLFFKQSPCDPESDLQQHFRPKPGCTLVFLPQSIIPVWRKEFAKFHDTNETRIMLQLRIAHGKHQKGHILTDTDVKALQCTYPKDVQDRLTARRYTPIAPTTWHSKAIVSAGSHQYIVITTPGSYEHHLLRRVNHQYRYSADEDPPLSGPGSKKKPRWIPSSICGLVPAWVIIDEFHLLKSLAKSHGPWQFIGQLQEYKNGALALIAMSGTPISIGPADIKGPLQCLQGLSDESRPLNPHPFPLEKLDDIHAEFNILLQEDPKSAAMSSLIEKFGKYWQLIALSRTDKTKWFGKNISELPAVVKRDIDVAFPPRLREALDQMSRRIAIAIYEGSSHPEGFKDTAFYATLTRQQLLASTIPWLVQYWNASEENREERFLARNYHVRYTNQNGNWNEDSPFLSIKEIYTTDMLPKFRALDKILRAARQSGWKILVFSQYIAVVSFAQGYINNHPQYSMPARLFHAHLSESVKEQLVSGFQEERVDGPNSEFKVKDPSLRPQVLCGVQSALGTGQNLFAGSVCVFMEPYSNPAHAKQALKRLHRRGQTREVLVYRLTCAGEGTGVLSERVLLHKAEARDIFAEGIFKTGEITRGNGNGKFEVGNDEEEEFVDEE